MKVGVWAVKENRKVYITEVLSDRSIDPLLQMAFLAQKDDEKIKESI